MTNDDREFLERRIKVSAFANVAYAAGFGSFGLGLTALGAYAAFTRVGWKGLLIAGIGLVLVWAAWGSVKEVRELWVPEKSRVLIELSSASPAILWAHATEGSYNVVKIYFADGTRTDLVAHGKKASRLLEIVSAQVPEVILGYGSEQGAAYAASLKQVANPPA